MVTRKLAVPKTFILLVTSLNTCVIQKIIVTLQKKIKTTTMTKEEHIKFWTETAEKDWNAVENLVASKNYLHALFFAHLVLEKLTKAQSRLSEQNL
jgi:hypothetical protein